jgi:hypothetical protein
MVFPQAEPLSALPISRGMDHPRDRESRCANFICMAWVEAYHELDKLFVPYSLDRILACATKLAPLHVVKAVLSMA